MPRKWFLLLSLALLVFIFYFFQRETREPLTVSEIQGPLPNPNGTYLSALLSYSSNRPTRVLVSQVGGGVEANETSKTLLMESPSNTEHLLPLMGMSSEEPTELAVQFFPSDLKPREKGESLEMRVTIPPVSPPPYTPEVTVSVDSPDLSNSLKRYLVTDQKYTFILSEEGELLWATDKFGVFLHQLPNGHFLVQGFKETIEYQSTTIYEIDLAGIVYQRYESPHFFHHEVIPYQGGILAASNSQPLQGGSLTSPNTEDAAIVFNRSGEMGQWYRMEDYLDETRVGLTSYSRKYDWFHLNGIAHDPRSDVLAFSGRTQSAVVGVDPTREGEAGLKWILASRKNPSAWGESQEKKLLSISDEDAPQGQHSLHWTPRGTLLLYDNGVERTREYSRGVEYEIDAENRTASLVREFDYDKRYYTPITGDVHELDPQRWLLFYAFFSDPTQPSRLVRVHFDEEQRGSIEWELLIEKYSPDTVYYRAYQLLP